MKKIFLFLVILFSFQIVHCQKKVKNLPKKPDSPVTVVEVTAPDTILMPLTQQQFILIKQTLESIIANTQEMQLLLKMDAEIKRQSKKQTKP